MSHDVRDILNISRQSSEKVSKKKKVEPAKRPTGMHREVFALLSASNDLDPPSLQKSSIQNKCSKHMQQLFGNRKVRSWQWKPFKNSARPDNLTLYHWRRCDDTSAEYPFYKYSKQCQVLKYTEEQYNGVLQHPGWTRPDTDHLIMLANRFDLRFVIMQDRWDAAKHGARTVETLKDRYYSILYRLNKLRDSECETPKQPLFDADHERTRKEQLEKLYSRTPGEVTEEEFLVEELRKIEIRRKEREKKQQDLQRLIYAADQHAESTITTKKKKVVSAKRKEEETKSWRIQDKAPGAGVSLRSAKIKLGLQVGQKKTKLVEQILVQLGVGLSPMPTEDISQQYNELRNDIIFLLELKIAQETLQFDIQTLRHRKETLRETSPDLSCDTPPDVSCDTPPDVSCDVAVKEEEQDTDISGLNLDEALLQAGLTTSCNRKRRAALQLEKVTSLLKKSRKSSKG